MDLDLRLRFERINPKVLNSFFIEKRSRMVCHQCGSENFTIPTLDNSLLVPHVFSSDGPDIPHQVYFYPVTCSNCGIMQSVNAQVVLDWFESRPQGEE